LEFRRVLFRSDLLRLIERTHDLGLFLWVGGGESRANLAVLAPAAQGAHPGRELLRRFDRVDQPDHLAAVPLDLLRRAIRRERPAGDQIMPDQPDLAGLREALRYRHAIDRELAVLAQIRFAGRPPARGLVVVDLEDTAVLAHQPVDVPLELIAPLLVEGERDPLLETQGRAVVERVLAAVKLRDAVHPEIAVMIRSERSEERR